ncbi:hypothetical protein ACNKHU_23115 [Shigella flexneri]
MAKMRMLQPKIRQCVSVWAMTNSVSPGMMALYKAEKVNPLGGCSAA